MGFNRLADASHDALNPRTAMRELPRGLMTRARGGRSSLSSSSRSCSCSPPGSWAAVFRAVAGGARDRVLVLARQAVHDLHPAVSRTGDGGCAGRRMARLPAAASGVEPWLLAMAIGTWVGGFDVLYACQDLAFDRAHGLRSIPVHFGVARSLLISRVHARVHGRLPLRYSGRSPISGRSISAASSAWPCCSSTSSRSCAQTICRRSRARSI